MSSSPAWVPCAGATVHMPSGARGSHLFVILNDGAQCAGYGPGLHFLSVSVSTIRLGIYHDKSCLLRAGCHPFVKVDSYVHYGGARIDSDADLGRFISQGVF